MNRRADELGVLAPVAQGTDFTADSDRHHFAARLLHGPQNTQFGCRLHHDAIELTRVGGKPLLHFGLRNLVGPHTRHVTHDLHVGECRQSGLDAAVLRIGTGGSRNTLNDQHVALFADFVTQPQAQILTSNLVVHRRVHRVRRSQVTGEREGGNALVIGIFHGLVQRSRVRAAHDDGVYALVHQLAHLLNLRRIFQVGLGNDHFFDQAEFFPFGNDVALQTVHGRGAPGITGVRAGIANGPGRALLGFPITVGAGSHGLRWIQHIRGVQALGHIG